MIVEELMKYLTQFAPDAEVLVNESTDPLGSNDGYEATNVLQTTTKKGVNEVHILY